MNAIKERISQLVIDELEMGIAPRRKTWNTYQTWSNDRPYSGVNQMVLQIQKRTQNYKSNRRMTFSQIKNQWGVVRKWEKGSPVVFYKNIRRKDELDEETKTFPMLKMYFVFNLDQTTLELEEVAINESKVEEYLRAKEIVENFTSWPDILFGPQPLYYPWKDEVRMPDKNDFFDMDEYYHTLFHELVHSTWHKDRLWRGVETPTNHYNYGVEELVAELWASYLSAEAEIETGVIENSKSYIRGRLNSIKEDKSILFKASSKGWKAKEYIINNGMERKGEQ